MFLNAKDYEKIRKEKDPDFKFGNDKVQQPEKKGKAMHDKEERIELYFYKRSKSLN